MSSQTINQVSKTLTSQAKPSALSQSSIQNKQINDKETMEKTQQMYPFNIKFETMKDVQKYAQQNKKTLLILEENILDVSTFALHHPGGAYLLKNRQLQNIQEDMKFHHPLSLRMANSMTIGSFKNQIKKIIDPNYPILGQIWKIDPQQYADLINSPHWMFQPSPRLFQSDFLEMFAHVKWYTVPILPICIMTYYFLQVTDWTTFTWASCLMYCFLGLLFFTFSEYSLHRFIFHSENIIPKTHFNYVFHFLTHGIHHMLPNDPDRLVLPFPLLSLILYVGSHTVGRIIAIQDPLYKAFFWSFFLIGYIMYDISHYLLHHVDTSKNKGGFFHRLQKYHNQHHFGGQEAGFGVSSPLWDIILNTGYKNKNKSS